MIDGSIATRAAGTIDLLVGRALAPREGGVARMLRSARESVAGPSTPAFTDADERYAFDHLERFTRYVDGALPTGLAPKHPYRGSTEERIRIELDPRQRNVARSEANIKVTFGPADASTGHGGLRDPLVLTHELSHALRVPRFDHLLEEGDADLVALGYARHAGLPSLQDAPWTVGTRDLLRPQHASMDALVGAMGHLSPFTSASHETGGPLGLAIARAGDSTGRAAMDRIALEAVFDELPARTARIEVDGAPFAPRRSDRIDVATGKEWALVRIAADHEAGAFLDVAARHANAAATTSALRRAFADSGITPRA